MRLKRHLIAERPVKLYADPIFLHFAIASLILAITGAVGAVLSQRFQKMLDVNKLLIVIEIVIF